MNPWSSWWVVEDEPEVRIHLPVTERRDEPRLTILLGKGVAVLNLPVHESATPPFPHHPLESSDSPQRWARAAPWNTMQTLSDCLRVSSTSCCSAATVACNSTTCSARFGLPADMARFKTTRTLFLGHLLKWETVGSRHLDTFN